MDEIETKAYVVTPHGKLMADVRALRDSVVSIVQRYDGIISEVFTDEEDTTPAYNRVWDKRRQFNDILTQIKKIISDNEREDA